MLTLQERYLIKYEELRGYNNFAQSCSCIARERDFAGRSEGYNDAYFTVYMKIMKINVTPVLEEHACNLQV